MIILETQVLQWTISYAHVPLHKDNTIYFSFFTRCYYFKEIIILLRSATVASDHLHNMLLLLK